MNDTEFFSPHATGELAPGAKPKRIEDAAC